MTAPPPGADARLYAVPVTRAEITRRRTLVAPGGVVEAWPDRRAADLFWMGEESKALLDSAGGALPAKVAVPVDTVAVYYGPRVCDLPSLPREESLKSRVLSGHGVAVAWITLDRFGQRTTYEPSAPDDPVFHLRRVGPGVAHVWRLFRDRRDAVAYAGEHHGRDSEMAEWAEALPDLDFDDLVERHRAR